jgi:DNA-binding FadR family transcriptional regulator
MATDENVKKVMDSLNDYWTMYYAPPSVRELMAMTCINSTSVVREALKQLAEDNKVVLAAKEQGTKYRSRDATPTWVIDAIRGYAGL